VGAAARWFPWTLDTEGRAEMIKKVKGGYKVLSENGKKNLGGPYKSKAEAEKRLRQVEFFKHRKG
jgi:phosphosulfolactate synthase (CoM biosynthesis protein A)